MANDGIVGAARADTRGNVQGSIGLAVLCACVLAFNWKYVYNFAAGPFPFDPSAAQSPSAIVREFVHAEGPLLRTGWAQETTVRFLRGLVETKSESAEYVAMRVGTRFLVVKVPADYPDQFVAGRLVRLPESIRTSLGADRVYQWMLDASTSYRWDFNLFVMIAAPLFVLSLLMTAVFAWQSGNLLRHPAIAPLSALGAPLEIVAAIEKDIRAAGAAARIGNVFITPSWIVVLRPSLKIISVRDLVAVAMAAPSRPSGTPWLHFWVRGRRMEEKIYASDKEATAIMARLAALLPWAVVTDQAAFSKRWSDDRAACEREAQTRRTPAAPAVPRPAGSTAS